MRTSEFDVMTRGRLVSDVTGHLESFGARSGQRRLKVFLPHATAGGARKETG